MRGERERNAGFGGRRDFKYTNQKIGKQIGGSKRGTVGQ